MRAVLLLLIIGCGTDETLRGPVMDYSAALCRFRANCGWVDYDTCYKEHVKRYCRTWDCNQVLSDYERVWMEDCIDHAFEDRTCSDIPESHCRRLGP